MFTNIKDNKYQILISSLLGFAYFYYSRNEIYSFILVLILSYVLRKFNIDKIINEKLSNQN